MDYLKKINELKNEKKQLIDKADALIAENKFGDELTQVQNDIKAKAAAITPARAISSSPSPRRTRMHSPLFPKRLTTCPTR